MRMAVPGSGVTVTEGVWVKHETNEFIDNYEDASNNEARCLKRAEDWAKHCFVKGMRVDISSVFLTTTSPVPAAGLLDNRLFIQKSIGNFNVEEYK